MYNEAEMHKKNVKTQNECIWGEINILMHKLFY